MWKTIKYYEENKPKVYKDSHYLGNILLYPPLPEINTGTLGDILEYGLYLKDMI